MHQPVDEPTPAEVDAEMPDHLAEVDVPPGVAPPVSDPDGYDVAHDLAGYCPLRVYRLKTERMQAAGALVRQLSDFLSRPVQAPGGPKRTDADVVSAYNLAVEAALHGIRKAVIDAAKLG